MGACWRRSIFHKEVLYWLRRIIATFWSKEEDNDAFEAGVQSLLMKISEQYKLTYGEKTQLLASMILEYSKYVIRWERHGTMNEEGEWE